MKVWKTTVRAIDPTDGELHSWAGDNVYAPTLELARQWCQQNKGYLNVIGELVSAIPCMPGTYDPDFANKIDYDVINNN